MKIRRRERYEKFLLSNVFNIINKIKSSLIIKGTKFIENF